MRAVRRIAAATFLALLLSSCASQKQTVAADTADLPSSALAEQLRERDRRITSMTGNGSIAFESNEAAGSAFFELSLKKPDSLLISFEGPFGIGAGFLFLCREKFVMYNSLDNRVITGAPTPRAIHGVIPVDLTLDQIMGAFTGGFPLPGGAPEGYTVEEGRFRLDYIRGGRRHTYWVDPSSDLVLRYEVSDSTGNPLFEAVASRMLEQDGISAPGRITLSVPPNGQYLTIYYSSLQLNAQKLSFDYAVPANARTTIR